MRHDKRLMILEAAQSKSAPVDSAPVVIDIGVDSAAPMPELCLAPGERILFWIDIGVPDEQVEHTP